MIGMSFQLLSQEERLKYKEQIEELANGDLSFVFFIFPTCLPEVAATVSRWHLQNNLEYNSLVVIMPRFNCFYQIQHIEISCKKL